MCTLLSVPWLFLASVSINSTRSVCVLVSINERCPRLSSIRFLSYPTYISDDHFEARTRTLFDADDGGHLFHTSSLFLFGNPLFYISNVYQFICSLGFNRFLCMYVWFPGDDQMDAWTLKTTSIIIVIVHPVIIHSSFLFSTTPIPIYVV
jgi:hypothetical protein